MTFSNIAGISRALAFGALAASAVMVSNSAAAATLTCASPQPTSFTLTAALDCAGSGGNDNEAAVTALADMEMGLGSDLWTLADKNDDTTSGDQSITFVDLEPANGSVMGDWAISAWPTTLDLILVLKAGNGFAAFLLEPFSTEGTWSSGRDLSHASLYYRESGDGGPAPVPVPAAGLMLLTALGGAAAMRRRG